MDNLKSLIFLAGFMGSGKSTVGPELARHLDYSFVDLDELIERQEEKSIPEIFKEKGESYFREIEGSVVSGLCAGTGRTVVALGGGALMDARTRAAVKQSGVLVYLRTDPEKILERVRDDRNRPMLFSREGIPARDEELLGTIRTLLNEREESYLAADLIVDTSSATVSETVGEIVVKLRGLVK